MVFSSHLKDMSFLRKALMGFILLEKIGTNLRIKFIFPKNDCKDFLLTWGHTYMIYWILFGSTKIPSYETMCPKSFPLSIPKIDFLGLKEIPYFLHLSKNNYEV
jgi:hypothetical protein